jgi:hypothetical protein
MNIEEVNNILKGVLQDCRIKVKSSQGVTVRFAALRRIRVICGWWLTSGLITPTVIYLLQYQAF